MATSWVQRSCDFYAARVKVYTHEWQINRGGERERKNERERERDKETALDTLDSVYIYTHTHTHTRIYALRCACASCRRGGGRGSKGSNASRPVCACIILDLMQPALPTLITPSSSTFLSSFSHTLQRFFSRRGWLDRPE